VISREKLYIAELRQGQGGPWPSIPGKLSLNEYSLRIANRRHVDCLYGFCSSCCIPDMQNEVLLCMLQRVLHCLLQFAVAPPLLCILGILSLRCKPTSRAISLPSPTPLVLSLSCAGGDGEAAPLRPATAPAAEKLATAGSTTSVLDLGRQGRLSGGIELCRAGERAGPTRSGPPFAHNGQHGGGGPRGRGRTARRWTSRRGRTTHPRPRRWRQRPWRCVDSGGRRQRHSRPLMGTLASPHFPPPSSMRPRFAASSCRQRRRSRGWVEEIHNPFFPRRRRRPARCLDGRALPMRRSSPPEQRQVRRAPLR
jgi:hypothetical protein